MSKDVAITVDGVSKKFCKSLKRGMLYGVTDTTRNLLGLSSNSDVLRPKEFWAVDDVSFELKKGEALGLIGPNGAGKTTMLQLLNGIFWPDKGKIVIRGRVGALIAVGAGFHLQLTGRENIYVNAAILGMTKSEVDRWFDEIVAFADVGDFLDTAVKHYSSGMFVRLGFAVAAFCDPQILLVDEVLAVGDAKFQRKCLNHLMELKRNGVSFILVSHSMQAIEGVANKGIAFNKGQVVYQGDVGEAIANYELLMLTDAAVGVPSQFAASNDPDDLVLVKKWPAGTDETSVEQICLLDDRRQKKRLFYTEDAVTVKAVINSTIKDKARLVVNFINEREFRCLGSTVYVDLDCGRFDVEVKFDPIQLSTGRYKVTFHVFDASYTNPYSNGHYGWFEVRKRGTVQIPGDNTPVCWAQPAVTCSRLV